MQRGIGVSLLALLSLACSFKVAAQQGHQIKDSSNSIWLAYIGEHPISQRWNLHLEGQLFSYGPAEKRELFFLRPGLRREFSHGMSALVTYAYFVKYPAVTNDSRALPEHRISGDIHWRHRLPGEGIKRLTLAHRLRVARRFEAQEDERDRSNTWYYAERFRYRLTANVPLPGNTAGPRPGYLSLYNEVFVNFGPHSRRVLDQNIAAGAIGWNLSPRLQFEIGYLLEYFPS